MSLDCYCEQTPTAVAHRTLTDIAEIHPQNIEGTVVMVLETRLK